MHSLGLLLSADAFVPEMRVEFTTMLMSLVQLPHMTHRDASLEIRCRRQLPEQCKRRAEYEVLPLRFLMISMTNNVLESYHAGLHRRICIHFSHIFSIRIPTR